MSNNMMLAIMRRLPTEFSKFIYFIGFPDKSCCCSMSDQSNALESISEDRSEKIDDSLQRQKEKPSKYKPPKPPKPEKE